MQSAFDVLFKGFKPIVPWGTNGDCNDFQYQPNKFAQAPYDKPGWCGPGTYRPFPDGSKTPAPVSTPGPEYYTSSDGVTVPVEHPAKPLGPMQGPPMPSTPLNVPLPPVRPADLGNTMPPATPSALQRYQAATVPSTFGSTSAGQFHTLTPEEAGPPMPPQVQVSAQPAQAAWESNFTRQDGGGDPSSPMAFMHQEAARNAGNGSGSLFATLFPNFNSNSAPAASNATGRGFQWVRPDSIVGKLMALMGNNGSDQATPNRVQGDGGGPPSLGDQMESARSAQANNIQGMSRGAAAGGNSLSDVSAYNQAFHQASQANFQASMAAQMARNQEQIRKAQLSALQRDPEDP